MEVTMKTLAMIVSMRLGALRLLPLALAPLAMLPGCLNEEARSELKCDANGCLVCERYTCYEYSCATDYQCPDGYGCNTAGQCKPSALSPGGGGTNTGGAQCAAQTCPTGASCEFGACVTPDGDGTPTECTLTAQCDGGFLCIDGACVDKPVVGDGTDGASDGTGGGSDGTDGASDGTGGASDGTGGASDGTGGATPAGCEADDDCASGEVCKAGACVEKSFPVRPEGTCQFNLDCGKDGTCVNTKCYFPPGDGCPDGSALKSALCLPDTAPAGECQLSADCGAGAICVNATCRTTCDADGDCAKGNRCGDEALCVLDDRPILQCLLSSDCGDSTCVDGRCLNACGGSAVCDAADACTFGFCMPTAACFEKSDCDADSDCIDGQCGQLGGADAGSSSGQDGVDAE